MKGIRNYALITLGFIFAFIVVIMLCNLSFPGVLDIGGNNILNFGTDNEHESSTPSNLTNPVTEAQDAAMKAELKNIQVALEHYYSENGSYPEDITMLVNGGYLQSIDINMAILEYQLVDQDNYILSTTLPSGAKYTLTPEGEFY